MPTIKVPKTPTPAILDKKEPSAADDLLEKQINQLQTLNKYFIDGVEDKPIGNRYFVDTKKKDKNGKKVYKLVDNMRYGVSPDGAIDMSQTGFLAPYQVKEGAANNSVEIDILDHSGNVITKSVTWSEYNSIACTAFPDNCKKVKGMEECEVCNIVNSNAPIDDVLNIDQSQIDKMAAAAAESEMESVENDVNNILTKSDESSQDVFDVFTDGFQNFYNRYKQPITNFTPQTNDTYIVLEEESIVGNKKVVIEKDIITTLWLGSITLLGLFIVAKHI